MNSQKNIILLILIIFLSACSSSMQPTLILPTPIEEVEVSAFPEMTPYPTRPAYEPGELVEYICQTGDNLDALAVRFNTTVKEIREANTFIPEDATTMPPGMPMQIPVYYRALWGTPYQMVPDAVFVNGPDATQFDSQTFISQHVGWLVNYRAWAFDGTRSAAEILDYVALQYSISPKILIALLEYQAGAFSDLFLSPSKETQVLGLESNYWTGVYLQLSYAANILNDGYYRWREGDLIEFELKNGSLIRPDPWQNAATVSLQYFFSMVLDDEAFHHAIGPNGFYQVFEDLFGDPWNVEPHIPGSLAQPEMKMPFERNMVWAYTGGPHTGWGSMAPWAALDFAPPSTATGCMVSTQWTTAVADGMISRDGEGFVVLDLDGDGDERTGWAVFYLHIAGQDRVPVGTMVKAGERIGHPSCEGGRSTGTHIHIARKYNGEWVSADSTIPFVLSGWRPIRGENPYQGWLVKGDMEIIANSNPDNHSFIPYESTNE
ncbi:MAG: LysM peptidoglycan-binding domain-containing M23 family metallopeptidase [Brevefilum sp.]|jgi:LasA protease